MTPKTDVDRNAQKDSSWMTIAVVTATCPLLLLTAQCHYQLPTAN